MTLGGTRNDRPLALLVAFAFALSLGIAVVAVPLVALEAGYDAPTIGFLVAAAAASQLATRFALPWLLGRYADRLLISVAGLAMLAGLLLLLASTAAPAFVAAQVLMGASRAIFWTSSQTHALRSGGSPVRRLVDLNLAGNAGTLSGPVLAGLLATIGLQVALGGAALVVAVTFVGAPFLRSFPAYDRRQSAGALRLLRREGVDAACWANVVGGVWWSMIGSYVPVILVGAGIGPTIIGLIVTLSEAAGAGALLVLRRTRVALVPRIVRAGAFVEMLALAAVAVAPPTAAAYAAALILGGAAAGCVTGLAPALVAMAAGEQEQGDALALSGTFRSLALLGAPASVGALLAVLPVSAALLAVAAAATVPGIFLGRTPLRARAPAID
jgi:Major Facilitator Superfamily